MNSSSKGLFVDLCSTLSNINFIFLNVSFRFGIKYRRFFIGPLWIFVRPLIYIILLGALFSAISGVPREVFIPHFAVGFIVWSLLGGYCTDATGLLKRYNGYIYSGNSSLTDIVALGNLDLLITFLHQFLIIIGLGFIFKFLSFAAIPMTLAAFLAICLNGMFITIWLSIVCARFKALPELVGSVVGIGFFVTPIIWMPSSTSGKSSLLDAFLIYNPFYHFLEIIRDPLIGSNVEITNWIVVAMMTFANLLLALLAYKNSKNVVFWIQE